MFLSLQCLVHASEPQDDPEVYKDPPLSPIQRYSIGFRVKTRRISKKMYAYNHGTGNHAYATPQGYAPNPAYGAAPGHASNPAYAPAPGYAIGAPPTVSVPAHTPTPPVLNPVQVPPGHHPIEVIQFWRDEYKRGQPYPLHWALFVRTVPRIPSPAPGPSAGTHGPGSLARARPRRSSMNTGAPRGNFYELVGTPDTYTAQFLPNVRFEPDGLVDWRGTHVIGWVHPGQMSVFETVVRQVPVWRHRPDWRSQQWVYEVVRTVGGSHQGVFMEGVTFGGLQRQMGRLLDAWENGDI